MQTAKLSVIHAEQQVDSVEDKIKELTYTIIALDVENTHLKDIVSSNLWDACDIEIEDIQDTVKELREQIRCLDIDNQALRDSRDMFQKRNAELVRQLKSMMKRT